VVSRECGIAGDRIVGKSPQEMGVPQALSLAQAGDEILTMAGAKT
jgi:hypothetical protein